MASLKYKLQGEATRYLIAGATNTAVTFGAYWLLLRALNYAAAYTIAYVLGIFLSYALNIYFVFRVAPNKRSAMAYPLVYLAQWIAGMLTLWIWATVLRLPASYGALVAIVVTVPVTFVLAKLILKRS